MKKASIFFVTTILIVSAATEAFAYAQKITTFTDIFYFDNNNDCVPAKAVTSCPIGSMPNCIEVLFDAVTANPLGISRQIYSARNNETNECEDPYTQP